MIHLIKASLVNLRVPVKEEVVTQVILPAPVEAGAEVVLLVVHQRVGHHRLVVRQKVVRRRLAVLQREGRLRVVCHLPLGGLYLESFQVDLRQEGIRRLVGYGN